MSELIARCTLRVREKLSAELFEAIDGRVLRMIITETLLEADPLAARVAELERWRRSFTP